MHTPIKKITTHSALPTIFLTLFAAQPIFASTFTGSSDLNITINSISNQTNPTQSTNLNIASDFNGINEDGLFTEGDGSVTPTYSQTLLPISAQAQDSMSQGFSINGAASDGSADASYYSNGTLTFENLSLNETYLIEIQLDYNISASITGNEDNPAEISETSLLFSDDLGSELIYDFVSASVFESFNSQQQDSQTFSLTLNPSQAFTYESQVYISGNVLSSVPIPATAWLFLSGLMAIPGLKKKTKTSLRA